MEEFRDLVKEALLETEELRASIRGASRINRI
jgi:hypothetical protein